MLLTILLACLLLCVILRAPCSISACLADALYTLLARDDVDACMSYRICTYCAGCNLAVDVTWKYLNFFMNDDNKLKHIESEYGSGRMLTGEAKAELIKVSAQPCATASHVVWPTLLSVPAPLYPRNPVCHKVQLCNVCRQVVVQLHS